MILKSFKDEYYSFRKNKMSILVLLVLPLIFALVLGLELSHEFIDNIPMAVIDYDKSTFSMQLTDAFDSNEIFNVVYHPENEDELEYLMKNSKARVGMVIPKNFYNDIALLKSPTVMMVYDGSHMSITSAAKTKATEILLTYKAGAAIKQLTARLDMPYEEAYNIAQAIKFSNQTLYNPTKSFDNFLSPILLAGYVQSAIALVAAVAVDHGIYKKRRSERLGYSTGKTIFYTLCGTIAFMINIVFQVVVFRLPFEGNILYAVILSAALSFSVSAFCILISALFENRMIAVVAGAVAFIPNSAMAGTTWPLLSMLSGYRSFAEFLPFTHYVSNIRYLYLKGFSINQIYGDIIYMLIFGAVMLLLSEGVMLIAEQKSDFWEVKADDLYERDEKGISLNI